MLFGRQNFTKRRFFLDTEEPMFHYKFIHSIHDVITTLLGLFWVLCVSIPWEYVPSISFSAVSVNESGKVVKQYKEKEFRIFLFRSLFSIPRIRLHRHECGTLQRTDGRGRRVQIQNEGMPEKVCARWVAEIPFRIFSHIQFLVGNHSCFGSPTVDITAPFDVQTNFKQKWSQAQNHCYLKRQNSGKTIDQNKRSLESFKSWRK